MNSLLFSLQSGGDPLVLCFVDFVSPAHAATAMDALQGEIDMLNTFCLEHISCQLVEIVSIFLIESPVLMQDWLGPHFRVQKLRMADQ